MIRLMKIYWFAQFLKMIFHKIWNQYVLCYSSTPSPLNELRIVIMWTFKVGHVWIFRISTHFLLSISNTISHTWILDDRGCDDGSGGLGCCTSSNPCGLGEGDCDDDSECSGSLICGGPNGNEGDNCDTSLGFESAWDCCVYPTPTTPAPTTTPTTTNGNISLLCGSCHRE